MRILDISRAGELSATETGRSGIWNQLVAAFTSRLNRQKVARLDHMTDAELLDIGLTRLDLHSALGESRFFEDPSRLLNQVKRPRA